MFARSGFSLTTKGLNQVRDTMIATTYRNPTICLLASVCLLLIPTHGLGQSAENIRWNSSFTIEPNGVDGRLNVMAEIDLGFHIYGTKKIHAEIPTSFSIEKGFTGVTIAGDFEADVDPVVGFDPATNEETTYYEGIVTWTAPIKFESATSPKPATIPIKIKGQICDEGSKCNLFSSEATSHFVPKIAPGDVFRPESAPVVFSGSLTPSVAKPGQAVALRLEAEPEPGWKIPGLIGTSASTESPTASKPTLVVLNKTNGWRVHDPIADPASKGTADGQGKLAWIISVDVPADAEKKAYSLGGLVAFQAEGSDGAKKSATFGFKVELPVGAESIPGTIPFSFEPGPSYEQIQKLLVDRTAAEKVKAGKFANYSIPAVMALAFLAGFILNFMPCVLPVIGLKIMSFVQQAGEHPGRVFLLNLAFALGVMAVFMVLAFVASRPSGSWGELFQNDQFQIVMIGVVFSFALSFLGVWEIPIPGMSGTGVAGKMAAKDGFLGAFVKGILTTLLATPCSGPLLIPTVIWALAQPQYLTYLTFAAMGLGMAMPYLVFGAFPKLVGMLPRPGNWMLTFKHTMGFAMLGAAIFLFGSLKEKFAIPTLSMLLAIGVACWVVGHTSIAAELRDKLKAWAWGLTIIAVGCWIAFVALMSQYELEWNTFSKALLEEKLAEGNIVFVDFTADW